MDTAGSVKYRGWVMKIAEKIRSRCRRDRNGCLIWTGAKTRSDPRAAPYGVVYIRPPFSTKRKKFRVHQMVYVATHSQVKYGMNDVSFEMSHLCHNSLCVEAAHLSMEPRSINNHRKNCKEEGRCLGGHGDYPSCIL